MSTMWLALLALWGTPTSGMAADPVARDIAAAAGVSYPGGRSSSSTEGESPAFDYDRDGDLDLLLSAEGGSPWPLLRNNGDGTFTEVLQGTFFKQDRHGCVAADFGSTGAGGRPDGRPDLYCVVGACRGQCTKEYPNELWLQTPKGTFVNVARSWGVADPHGRGREGLAIDYDRDGLTDIVVVNEGPSIFPTPNRLFHNVGGAFREVTNTPIRAEKDSECGDIGDIDGDGYREVLLCSTRISTQRILTYRNTSGSFRDVTASTAYKGMPARLINLSDVNRDGRPDLLIVTQTKLAIWLNVAGGFPRQSFSFPLQEGRHVAVGDVNLDRAPDIYVVQGQNAAYRDIMLINNGNGVSYHSMPIPQVKAGDGDVAVPIPNWGGTGRMAVLVTNGKFDIGPVELIAFSAR